MVSTANKALAALTLVIEEMFSGGYSRIQSRLNTMTHSDVVERLPTSTASWCARSSSDSPGELIGYSTCTIG